MVCFCRDTEQKNLKSMIRELPSSLYGEVTIVAMVLIETAKESRPFEQRMLSRCKITGWSEVPIILW